MIDNLLAKLAEQQALMPSGANMQTANIWSNAPRNRYATEGATSLDTQSGFASSAAWNFNTNRPFNIGATAHATSSSQGFASSLVNPSGYRYGGANLRVDTTRGMNGFGNDPGLAAEFATRRNNPPSRPGSAFDPRMNFFGGYAPGMVPVDIRGVSPPATPMSIQSMTGNMYPPPMPYQPRPIGTRLSPTAAEFNGEVGGNPWNMQPPNESAGPTYIPAVEPLNYRRLLDRNASCNWGYIVEKITCNNDQQASIFLQQKLKSATPEHKFEIVEAIIAKAYPLMVNRFGNFLVQRCFEHGTVDQVVAIANAIRGNTLQLSMDAFGCHVVQKAFDAVPEEYKAVMVHELLRRIPETVVHRYACHVWQKLFELRWSDSPPQIMKYVNEALRGMWHEVAMGETGSLVVQNIFENCLEEDKVSLLI